MTRYFLEGREVVVLKNTRHQLPRLSTVQYFTDGRPDGSPFNVPYQRLQRLRHMVHGAQPNVATLQIMRKVSEASRDKTLCPHCHQPLPK